jgi:hypothetical protein
MIQKFNDLKNSILGMQHEADAAYAGNKSAGRRLRVGMMELTRQAKAVKDASLKAEKK